MHEFHLHSEFYADFGLYDVSLTVPSDYTVGATGELTGAPVKKDGKTTYRYVQGDVHDFAWTADKRTAKPLEATWTYPGGDPVKVKVLFPPEYADNAPTVLKATMDSLTYFSKTLGRYPYRTVTAVIPPYNAGEAGGMEYPTFFTADSTLNYQPGGIEQYLLEFVTIHEFGHGYFYGILASNEFEEPMLDEGVNQYWDSRMLSDRKQRVVPMPARLARMGFAPGIDPHDLDRLTAGLGNAVDPLGNNSWDRRNSSSYGSVYARTSALLHGIEKQVGREAMSRGMTLYYERWKFRHPSTADFREALAKGPANAKSSSATSRNRCMHRRWSMTRSTLSPAWRSCPSWVMSKAAPSPSAARRVARPSPRPARRGRRRIRMPNPATARIPIAPPCRSSARARTCRKR